MAFQFWQYASTLAPYKEALLNTSKTMPELNEWLQKSFEGKTRNP
jgi:hypothetical protein